MGPSATELLNSSKTLFKVRVKMLQESPENWAKTVLYVLTVTVPWEAGGVGAGSSKFLPGEYFTIKGNPVKVNFQSKEQNLYSYLAWCFNLCNRSRVQNKNEGQD